jgi:hypothetical protein
MVSKVAASTYNFLDIHQQDDKGSKCHELNEAIQDDASKKVAICRRRYRPPCNLELGISPGDPNPHKSVDGAQQTPSRIK